MENKTTTAKSPLAQKYDAARSNLLLMLVLTAVNIVLLFTSADLMLLFSATIPYVSTIVAMELFAYGYDVIGYGYVAATVIPLALYLVCWILSKKKVGWMITAFVLFILDTIYMAYIYISAGDASGILDVVIHALVLYYLFVGVKSGLALKNQPEEVDAEVELK